MPQMQRCAAQYYLLHIFFSKHYGDSSAPSGLVYSRLNITLHLIFLVLSAIIPIYSALSSHVIVAKAICNK